MFKSEAIAHAFEIITGQGLGTTRSSLAQEGVGSLWSTKEYGQAKVRVCANVANGNVSVRDHEVIQKGMFGNMNGQQGEVRFSMHYNSQASSGNTAWRFSLQRQFTQLPDPNNPSSGTPANFVDEEGAQIVFTPHQISGSLYYKAPGFNDGTLLLSYDSAKSRWVLWDTKTNVKDYFTQDGVWRERTDEQGRLSTLEYTNNQVSALNLPGNIRYEFRRPDANTMEIHDVSNGGDIFIYGYSFDSNQRLTASYAKDDTGAIKYTTSYNYLIPQTASLAKIIQSDTSMLGITCDGYNRVISIGLGGDSSIGNGEVSNSYIKYNNPQGSVTVRDGGGHNAIVQCDGQSRVQTLQRQDGYGMSSDKDTIGFTYTDDGQAATKTSNGNKLWTRTYDALLGFLSSITQQNGQFQQFFQGENADDIFNCVVHAENTAIGNDPQSQSFRSVYDNFTTPDGYKGRFLRALISPLGRVIEFRQDADGNVASIREYLNDTFDYESFKYNQAPDISAFEAWVAKISDPSKVKLTEFKYNARAQTTTKNVYANVTIDDEGHVVGVQDDQMSEDTWKWNSFGQWQTHTFKQTADAPKPVTETKQQDFLQRETLNVDGVGNQTQTAFIDSAANIVVTRPNGRTEQTNITNASLPSSKVVIGSIDGSSNKVTRKTTYSRDTNGLPIITALPDGRKKIKLFDKQNRPGFILKPVGNQGSTIAKIHEIDYNETYRFKKITRYNKTVDTLKLYFSYPKPPQPGELPLADLLMPLLKDLSDPNNDRITYEFLDESGRPKYDIDEEGYVIEHVWDTRDCEISTIHYATALTPAQILALTQGQTVTPTKDIFHDYQINTFYDADKKKIGFQESGMIVAASLKDNADIKERLKTRTENYFKFEGNKDTPILLGYVTEFVLNAASQQIEQISYDTATPMASTLAAARPGVMSFNDDHTKNFLNNRGDIVAQKDGVLGFTENTILPCGLPSQSIRYQNNAKPGDTVAEARPTPDAQRDRTTVPTYDGLNRITQDDSNPLARRDITTFNSMGDVTQSTSCDIKSLTSAAPEVRGKRYQLNDFRQQIAELNEYQSFAVWQIEISNKPNPQKQQEIAAIWQYHSAKHTYDPQSGLRLTTTTEKGYRTVFYYDQDSNPLLAITFQLPAQGQPTTCACKIVEETFSTFKQETSKRTYLNALNVDVTTLTGGFISNDFLNSIHALQTSNDPINSSAYSRRGLETLATDGENYKTATEFDAHKNQTKITRDINLTTKEVVVTDNDFDPRKKPLSTTQDVGGINAVTQFEHDNAHGNETARIDAIGNVTRKGYDAIGQESSDTDALENNAYQTHSHFHEPATETSYAGNTTTHDVNPTTRENTQTSPMGRILIEGKNVFDQTQSTADSDGATTSRTFEPDGQEKTFTNAVGETSTDVHDPDTKLLITHTTASKLESLYNRFSDGQVQSSVDNPQPTPKSTPWKKAIPQQSPKTSYQKDMADRTTGKTDPNNNNETYGLDRRNLRVNTTRDPKTPENPNALALTTNDTFDGLRNRTSRVEGSVDNSSQCTTAWQYNHLGDCTQEMIDPNGLKIAKHRVLDAARHLRRETDANGNTTFIIPDANGNRRFVVVDKGDGTGEISEFEFNPDNKEILHRQYYATLSDITVITDTMTDKEFSVYANPLKNNALDDITAKLYDKDKKLIFTARLRDGEKAMVTQTLRTPAGKSRGSYEYSIFIPSAFLNEAPSKNGYNIVPPVKNPANDRQILDCCDLAGNHIFSIDGEGTITKQIYDNVGDVIATIRYAIPMPTDVYYNLNLSLKPNELIATLDAWVNDPIHQSPRDRIIYQVFDILKQPRFIIPVERGTGQGFVSEFLHDDDGNKITTNVYTYRITPDTDPTKNTIESIEALLENTDIPVEENLDHPFSKLKPIPSLCDTNSFYQAIGAHTGKTPKELRRQLAKYMYSKRDEYKSILEEFADRNLLTLKESIMEILKEKTAATHVEISFMMKLLGRPIVLIGAHNEILNTVDVKEFSGDPIFVFFDKDIHYQSFSIEKGIDAKALLAKILKIDAERKNLIAKEEPKFVQGPNPLYRSTSFTFDAANRKRTENDGLNPLPKKWDYTGIFLTTETTNYGQVWTHQYDGAKREIATISPETDVEIVPEDTQNSTLIRAHRITQYGLDGIGNAITVTKGVVSPQTVKNGKLKDVVILEPRTVNVGFNVHSEVASTLVKDVKVDDPNVPDPSIQNPYKTVDLSTATYYRNTRKVSSQDRRGNWQYWVWSNDGKLAFHIDENKNVTQYSCNAFGEVENITRYNAAIDFGTKDYTKTGVPFDVMTTFINTPAVKDDPKNREITISHNRQGLKVLTLLSKIFFFNRQYDDQNNPIYGEAQPQSSWVYNAFKELIESDKLIDTSGLSDDEWIWRDERGNVIVHINSDGHAVQYSYETADKVPTKIIDYFNIMDINQVIVNGKPISNEEIIELLSQNTSIRDEVTTFGYNILGQQIEKNQLNVWRQSPEITDAANQNRVTQVNTFYAALTTSTPRTPDGQIAAAVNPAGGREDYGFNECAEKVSTLSPIRANTLLSDGVTRTNTRELQGYVPNAHGNKALKYQRVLIEKDGQYDPNYYDAKTAFNWLTYFDNVGKGLTTRAPDLGGGVVQRAYDENGKVARRFWGSTHYTPVALPINVKKPPFATETRLLQQMRWWYTPTSKVYREAKGCPQTVYYDKYWDWNSFGEWEHQYSNLDTKGIYRGFNPAGYLYFTNEGHQPPKDENARDKNKTMQFAPRIIATDLRNKQTLVMDSHLGDFDNPYITPESDPAVLMTMPIYDVRKQEFIRYRNGWIRQENLPEFSQINLGQGGADTSGTFSNYIEQDLTPFGDANWISKTTLKNHLPTPYIYTKTCYDTHSFSHTLSWRQSPQVPVYSSSGYVGSCNPTLTVGIDRLNKTIYKSDGDTPVIHFRDGRSDIVETDTGQYGAGTLAHLRNGYGWVMVDFNAATIPQIVYAQYARDNYRGKVTSHTIPYQNQSWTYSINEDGGIIADAYHTAAGAAWRFYTLDPLLKPFYTIRPEGDVIRKIRDHNSIVIDHQDTALTPINSAVWNPQGHFSRETYFQGLVKSFTDRSRAKTAISYNGWGIESGRTSTMGIGNSPHGQWVNPAFDYTQDRHPKDFDVTPAQNYTVSYNEAGDMCVLIDTALQMKSEFFVMPTGSGRLWGERYTTYVPQPAILYSVQYSRNALEWVTGLYDLNNLNELTLGLSISGRRMMSLLINSSTRKGFGGYHDYDFPGRLTSYQCPVGGKPSREQGLSFTYRPDYPQLRAQAHAVVEEINTMEPPHDVPVTINIGYTNLLFSSESGGFEPQPSPWHFRFYASNQSLASVYPSSVTRDPLNRPGQVMAIVQSADNKGLTQNTTNFIITSNGATISQTTHNETLDHTPILDSTLTSGAVAISHFPKNYEADTYDHFGNPCSIDQSDSAFQQELALSPHKGKSAYYTLKNEYAYFMGEDGIKLWSIEANSVGKKSLSMIGDAPQISATTVIGYDPNGHYACALPSNFVPIKGYPLQYFFNSTLGRSIKMKSHYVPDTSTSQRGIFSHLLHKVGRYYGQVGDPSYEVTMVFYTHPDTNIYMADATYNSHGGGKNDVVYHTDQDFIEEGMNGAPPPQVNNGVIGSTASDAANLALRSPNPGGDAMALTNLHGNTQLPVGMSVSMSDDGVPQAPKQKSYTHLGYNPDVRNGNFSAELPTPKLKKHASFLDTLVEVAVVTVVSMAAPELFEVMFGALLAELSAVEATMLALTLTGVAGGITELAGEATEMALGETDRISLARVASAAVVNAASAGLGFNPAQASSLTLAMAEGFTRAMLSQGVMLGFGLEKHLDMKSVVAQTIGAGIGKELHSTMAGKLSDRVSFAEQNLDELLNSTLSNLIETGRLDVSQIAAESLGTDAGTLAMDTQTFMANQSQITGANAQYKGVMAQQMQTPTVEGGYRQDLNGYDVNPQDPFTKELALGATFQQASAASIPGTGIHSALGSSAASAHNNIDVTPHLEKAAQAHPSIAQAVAPTKRVQPFSKPSSDIHTQLAPRDGIASRARTTSGRPASFFGGNHAPTPYVNPNKNPDAATQSRTDYNLPQNPRHYAEVSAATMERDARHAAVVQHGNVHAGVRQAVVRESAKTNSQHTALMDYANDVEHELMTGGRDVVLAATSRKISSQQSSSVVDRFKEEASKSTTWLSSAAERSAKFADEMQPVYERASSVFNASARQLENESARLFQSADTILDAKVGKVTALRSGLKDVASLEMDNLAKRMTLFKVAGASANVLNAGKVLYDVREAPQGLKLRTAVVEGSGFVAGLLANVATNAVVDASTGGLAFAGGIVVGVAADSAMQVTSEYAVGHVYDDISNKLRL